MVQNLERICSRTGSGKSCRVILARCRLAHGDGVWERAAGSFAPEIDDNAEKFSVALFEISLDAF